MIRLFLGTAEFVRLLFPRLKLRLVQANIDRDEREYIASAIASAVSLFLCIMILLSVIFMFLHIRAVKLTIICSSLFAGFIFLQRMFYPTIAAMIRIRDIERNLLPVLQSIFVQLNSGVVLFEILVNISKSDYGEITRELARTVKEINGGKSQIDALEDLAARNPSLFFRRSIWQVINGMKAGSEISGVVKESIFALAEEQVIQIQSYGSRLAPLAMFYMFTAIIIPALSITFILLFLSFSGLSEQNSKMIFYVLYSLVFFSQFLFLSLINSMRPNLL